MSVSGTLVKSLRRRAAAIVVCLFTVGKQRTFPGGAAHLGKDGEAAVFLPTAPFAQPVGRQKAKKNQKMHLTVGWMCVREVSLQREQLRLVVTPASMWTLTLQ